jgi:hypothetical protein
MGSNPQSLLGILPLQEVYEETRNPSRFPGFFFVRSMSERVSLTLALGANVSKCYHQLHENLLLFLIAFLERRTPESFKIFGFFSRFDQWQKE